MNRDAIRAIAIMVRDGVTDPAEIRKYVEITVAATDPRSTAETLARVVDDTMALYGMVGAIVDARLRVGVKR